MKEVESNQMRKRMKPSINTKRTCFLQNKDKYQDMTKNSKMQGVSKVTVKDRQNWDSRNAWKFIRWQSNFGEDI